MMRIVRAALVLIADHTLAFTDMSSELEAKLKHELEHTERLDSHFVEYLRSRDMAPTSRSDSAAGSLHHTYELLSPELQVYTWEYYKLLPPLFIAVYLNAVWLSRPCCTACTARAAECCLCPVVLPLPDSLTQTPRRLHPHPGRERGGLCRRRCCHSESSCAGWPSVSPRSVTGSDLVLVRSYCLVCKRSLL